MFDKLKNHVQDPRFDFLCLGISIGLLFTPVYILALFSSIIWCILIYGEVKK